MDFKQGQVVFYSDVPATVTNLSDVSVELTFKSTNRMSMGLEFAQEVCTETPRIPEVGMGATELMHSDRHAHTVVRVSASGKTFWAQQDHATRTDKNGMSDCQSYTYEPDTSAPMVEVRLTKKGWKAVNGSRFHLGTRREYHDFSF